MFTVCDDLVNMLLFLLDAILVNMFPVSGLTAMFMTALYSSRNFGRNSSLHLAMINIIGFKTACLIGFTIQAIYLFEFSRIVSWLERGYLKSEE
jgi:hypothetical protein